MRTSLAATLAACSIVFAACQEKSPSAPPGAHLQFDLQDGAHNNGNPDFFFLPPMVADPSGDASFDAGAFDPNLQPVVVVCALTEAGCGATVAQFSMTSGTGSERIRVDTVDGYYIVNWHTGASNRALDPTLNYRIVVSVGATRLGFADVDVVSNGKGLRNVQTGQYIGLVNGRTLPIKFRIEDAALCDPPGTRPCTSETVDIGADAPEHTILLYTDAGEPYGALRTQPQTGLDPGTTVTFTLQPCDGFTGAAASGYTKISDCLHITADPPIPEILPNGFSPKATVSVCTPISIPYPAPAAAGVFRQDDETGQIFELDHSDENICAPPGGAAHRAAQWHTGLPPTGNTPFTSRIEAAIPTEEGAWSAGPDMPAPRSGHQATLLPDGRVLIVGGTASGALLFDPGTETFANAASPAFDHRQGLTATRLADGRVFVVGGTGARFNAETYDPSAGTFTASSDTAHASRIAHTATLLQDGRVLLAGGQYDTTVTDQNGTHSGPQTHAHAEIYDPTTDGFTQTGDLHVDRSGHAAVRLPDGRVLIVGGVQTTTPGTGLCLSSAELFDPSSGTFTLLAHSMVQPRCDPTATLLGNGLVLITGGLFDSSTELFDPAQGTFSLTGSESVPHAFGTATLLADGRVLVVGGATAVGPVTTATAEIFAAATGTFSPAASMSIDRQEHSATLLADGRVLVVGGHSATAQGDLASTELFSLAPIP